MTPREAFLIVLALILSPIAFLVSVMEEWDKNQKIRKKNKASINN